MAKASITRIGGTNATEVLIGESVYLFSYSTLVAIARPGVVQVTEKRWSNTTTKHINQFIRRQGGPVERLPQSHFDSLQLEVVPS